MRTPTYEDYLADPTAFLESSERAARVARAEAVHELIVAPLKRLWMRTAQKPARRLQTQSA